MIKLFLIAFYDFVYTKFRIDWENGVYFYRNKGFKQSSERCSMQAAHAIIIKKIKWNFLYYAVFMSFFSTYNACFSEKACKWHWFHCYKI